ncbi:transmembrane protein 98-like [Branchiostoma floridae]|uniref:Transmembrane protein 98 n=1 Tax=Branchiostoma floridae TaxID=7739 RepID=C3Z8L1_BRAFL|nr:transmembrane protein 98-like [Branchiostoma floridae]XP_035688946.1 transmembrane protein 98-like [Branchiostoma floridae]|eukprot:XP_002595105.1 hypothetical protein BRAFLDRAFT_115231 [Branchiostoma floridae]
METVVAVAIAILAAIFVASLISLLLVCKQKYCGRADLYKQSLAINRPTVELVSAMETHGEVSDVELTNVAFTPDIDDILENEAWIDDASGLIPHCLAILKTCHQLTEKLVGMTMNNSQIRSQADLGEVVVVAKRISPRVDDVVRSMYPPLDPKLLEARSTALLLSVSHLALVTKNACKMPGSLDWIDNSISDMEEHMSVLRQAAMSTEEQTPSEALEEPQSSQL